MPVQLQRCSLDEGRHFVLIQGTPTFDWLCMQQRTHDLHLHRPDLFCRRPVQTSDRLAYAILLVRYGHKICIMDCISQSIRNGQNDHSLIHVQIRTSLSLGLKMLQKCLHTILPANGMGSDLLHQWSLNADQERSSTQQLLEVYFFIRFYVNILHLQPENQTTFLFATILIYRSAVS